MLTEFENELLIKFVNELNHSDLKQSTYCFSEYLFIFVKTL